MLSPKGVGCPRCFITQFLLVDVKIADLCSYEINCDSD